MAALRVRARQAHPQSHEALRSLLVHAGQFEQALHDCPLARDDSPALAQAVHLTDLAAAAFCSAYAQRFEAAAESLSKLSGQLRDLHFAADMRLTVKVPEGFEFYALYPEQYCAAAWQWTERHVGIWPKRAAVIGIRSIGTALSAVVAAVLRARGWELLRSTVRPTGHPFARQVELRDPDVAHAICALVVDEGPGISGSSMAAAARTLAGMGVPNVSFFPGHNGEPGAAASPEIRRWWSKTPRCVTALGEVKWNGRSLTESLAEKSRELFDAPEPFDTIEDLSAGQWRRYAFDHEAAWPAVATRFERMKFRCSDRNGRAVLWKFAGLGGGPDSNAVMIRLQQLASHHFTPAPFGMFCGFTAAPWIDGARLTRTDGEDPAVLDHIGCYLLRAARPALPSDEAAAAIARLADMLYRNTAEALDSSLAGQTRRWAEAAQQTEVAFSYGDGHLAPHEWIRTSRGRILKTDAEGHDADHTMVGRQALHWDIAGVLVEWNLTPKAAAPLLARVERAGVEVEPDALAFYQMAYAAFRMGLSSLAAGQTADDSEQQRLRRAERCYRDKLARLIKTGPKRRSRRRQEALT